MVARKTVTLVGEVRILPFPLLFRFLTKWECDVTVSMTDFRSVYRGSIPLTPMLELLPGGLTVGRVTLTHKVLVRIQAGQCLEVGG